MLVRSSHRDVGGHGTNSLLTFTKLAAITEDTGSYSSHTLIEALSAGDVELAKLATISGGPVALESDGSGSKLNAPLLTSVTGNIFQQYLIDAAGIEQR